MSFAMCAELSSCGQYLDEQGECSAELFSFAMRACLELSNVIDCIPSSKNAAARMHHQQQSFININFLRGRLLMEHTW